jgi:hypothetical protein
VFGWVGRWVSQISIESIGYTTSQSAAARTHGLAAGERRHLQPLLPLLLLGVDCVFERGVFLFVYGVKSASSLSRRNRNHHRNTVQQCSPVDVPMPVDTQLTWVGLAAGRRNKGSSAQGAKQEEQGLERRCHLL